jgi:hypothetical protein
VLDGVFNATNSEPILYLFVCGLTPLPAHIGNGMNLIDLRVRIQPSKNGKRTGRETPPIPSAITSINFLSGLLRPPISLISMVAIVTQEFAVYELKIFRSVLSINGTPGRGSISIRQPAMNFATPLPELSADIDGERKME